MIEMRNKTKALIYASLSIFAWSFIPLVSSLAQKKIDGSDFLLYSNLLSVVAIYLYAKIFKDSFYIDKKSVKQTAFLGFLGTFLYYVCIYYGYKVSNPVEVIIVQYLWPIFIVLLSVFMLHERLSIKKIFSIILGFLSVIIVMTKGNLSYFGFDFPLGLWAVFLGALSFALFSVLSKKIDVDPLSATLLFFVWGSIYSFVWVLLEGGLKIADTENFLYILLNGIVINGISYIWWIEAVRLWEASKISVLVYITPVLGTFWLVLFVGQKLFMSYVTALIFVIIAGILTIWERDENTTYIKQER